MISARNIIRHELIGLSAVVVRASNPTHVGIAGPIVDETRNTVRIRSVKGIRIVPKDRSLFRLTLPDGTRVEVEGSRLIGAPERRVTLRPEKEQR